MTLPAWRFGDPAGVAASDELAQAKREKGCGVCRYRDHNRLAWGTAVCGIGKTPIGGRLFCIHWRHEDDA